MIRRFTTILLCCSLVAAAQSKKRTVTAPPPSRPAQPQVPEIREFPIATFQVEGNLLYPTAAIIAVAGLKATDPANKERFEAAREKLLETGAFDSVGYRYFTASDGSSYEAVWQIEEANPVYPIKIEDLPMPQPEFEAALKAKDPLYIGKLPPTKARLDFYRSMIQDLAAQKGFKGDITAKVDAEGPENLVVLFRPTGATPVIADVKFLGAEVVPQSLLRNAINGVAVGSRYNEAKFRQLLDTSVRPLYEARGRLKTSFPKIAVIPAMDVNGLVATVTVEEGPVYQLGEVNIQGAGAEGSELARIAKFAPGEIANMKTIGESVEKMQLFLKQQGYMQANATVDRQVDDAKKVVNLTINMAPGRQYTFGKLEIVGLDIESEPVIRKMWGLQPGKPFNPDYPERFMTRVREDGIFENLGATKTQQKINEAAETVDITLIFGGAAKDKSILRPDPK